MKLIMENWRHYSKQINEDKNFQLVLESIENAPTQESADLIVERWIEEQDKILNEIEMLKKGKEFIDRKLNDFLINLYFKGLDIIKRIFQVGLKVATPAIKILGFISNKVSSVLGRFPVVGLVARASLLSLAMLCVMGALNVAFAGEPDPEKVKTMTKLVNVIQGICADQVADVSNISGAQELLSTESDQLKTMYADCVNQTEQIQAKVQSGEVKSLKDVEKHAGDAKQVVKSVIKFMKDLVNNPPEGTTKADQYVAFEKWEKVGEAVESAVHSVETTRTEYEGPGVKGVSVRKTVRSGLGLVGDK